MSNVSIVLGQISDRKIALCWRDNTLMDLFIESDAPTIGTIYRVKVMRALKGQGAYLVETPDGPGWLKDKSGLRPGDHVLAQISAHPGPGKAIPLTRSLTFRSRYAVITPGKPGHNVSRAVSDAERRNVLASLAAQAGEYGAILRSACSEAEDTDIADDLLSVTEAARSVLSDGDQQTETLLPGDDPHQSAWCEWWDATSVEEGDEALEAQDAWGHLRTLLKPEIGLSNGSRLWIETTQAFVAIDVDTGSDTSPTAGAAANTALAEELPRQLTLRGLGGQIVVDPAPMNRKHRQGFDQRLTRFLRANPVATDLVGWTALGHIELSRKRSRVPLAEALKGRDV